MSTSYYKLSTKYGLSVAIENDGVEDISYRVVEQRGDELVPISKPFGRIDHAEKERDRIGASAHSAERINHG